MSKSKLEAIQQKNYYEILNVGRDAPTETIRESYKEIAKLYHPDSNFYAEIIQDPLTVEETEIFKLITLAYTTLTNAEKRAEYDNLIPKGLKSWEDEDVPWEHSKSRTPQTESTQEDPTLRTRGAIDLARLNQLRVQKPASNKTPAVSKASAKTILILCIGLGLAIGLCVSIAILLFVKIF